MKRKIIVFKFIMLAALTSGCSVIEQQMNSNLANKSILERTEQAVFGDEKTGIAECDQILERLDEQSKTANESTLDATKRVAVKQAILNQVRARAGTTNMSQENKTFYGNRCREIYNQFLASTPAPANK